MLGVHSHTNMSWSMLHWLESLNLRSRNQVNLIGNSDLGARVIFPILDM